MSLPHARILLDREAWGRMLVWTFLKKGDQVPVHSHEEWDTHIIFALFGKGRALGEPRFHGKIIQPMPGGLVFGPFKAGELHGFEADEDGFTIGNLWLQPRPPDKLK